MQGNVTEHWRIRNSAVQGSQGLVASQHHPASDVVAKILRIAGNAMAGSKAVKPFACCGLIRTVAVALQIVLGGSKTDLPRRCIPPRSLATRVLFDSKFQPKFLLAERHF